MHTLPVVVALILPLMKSRHRVMECFLSMFGPYADKSWRVRLLRFQRACDKW